MESNAWLRFSTQTREVLSFAQEEAFRANHCHIERDHILIGLLLEPDGRSGHILRQLGLDVEDVRMKISQRSKQEKSRRSKKAELSPTVKKILESAVQAARRRGEAVIQSEHLLLGLIEQNDGPATDIFATFGVQVEQIQAEIEKLD